MEKELDVEHLAEPLKDPKNDIFVNLADHVLENIRSECCELLLMNIEKCRVVARIFDGGDECNKPGRAGPTGLCRSVPPDCAGRSTLVGPGPTGPTENRSVRRSLQKVEKMVGPVQGLKVGLDHYKQCEFQALT